MISQQRGRRFKPNTPEGRFVGSPGCEERYRQWSMFAFDPSEKAINGGRERQWIAVRETELDRLPSGG